MAALASAPAASALAASALEASAPGASVPVASATSAAVAEDEDVVTHLASVPHKAIEQMSSHGPHDYSMAKHSRVPGKMAWGRFLSWQDEESSLASSPDIFGPQPVVPNMLGITRNIWKPK